MLVVVGAMGDRLEDIPWNITLHHTVSAFLHTRLFLTYLGLTLATETGKEYFIVLVYEVEATVVRD